MWLFADVSVEVRLEDLCYEYIDRREDAKIWHARYHHTFITSRVPTRTECNFRKNFPDLSVCFLGAILKLDLEGARCISGDCVPEFTW